MDYVNETKGNARLPGIMTLGYIAAFSETLALAIIVAKAVAPLAQALSSETEEHIPPHLPVQRLPAFGPLPGRVEGNLLAVLRAEVRPHAFRRRGARRAGLRHRRQLRLAGIEDADDHGRGSALWPPNCCRARRDSHINGSAGRIRYRHVHVRPTTSRRTATVRATA